MKMKVLRRLLLEGAAGVGAAVMALGLGAPESARGCACGCGVFDVGTSDMLPTGPGGMMYLNYAYQDQDVDWSGASSGLPANNADKEIQTEFVTLGMQYMFNRSWGLQAELPYDVRYYRGAAGSTTWGSFGDLRIEGIYSGFSPDMSAGVTYGLKLPTGNFTHDDSSTSSLLDRDTELGTGSTDLLLGGYYRHPLASVTDGLYWFAQAQLDVPVLIQGDYRPGIELDTAFGLYYQRWTVGKVRITPVAQVIPSYRGRDTGSWASGGANDPPLGEVDSGYQRVLLSPGIEFDLHPWRFYADVEIPVYQDFTGNQLVGHELVKCGVSYMF